MKLKTVAVVGLGLMGGSLAARIRRVFPKVKVIGISRDAAAIRHALGKRWIHAGGSDLKLAREADLVVLSTPVNTLAGLLSSLEKIARPGTLVTDQGSVKGEIAAWAAKRKFKKIQFVGAHPMAGSQTRGIRHASADLFQNSFVFITPTGREPKTAVRVVTGFWKRIAGRTFSVTPDVHDRITARISHLPHATAACLMLSVSPAQLKFAARGFRDATRMAEGDSSVWLPIFTANRREISQALGVFTRQADALRRALDKKDAGALGRLLKRAGALRKGLRQG